MNNYIYYALRGGLWGGSPFPYRIAYRDRDEGSIRFLKSGFRVVRRRRCD